MEDNTEIAEEMSLGNLNHIPKSKLLAFFGLKKILIAYLKSKNTFFLNKKNRKQMFTRLNVILSLQSYFKI